MKQELPCGAFQGGQEARSILEGIGSGDPATWAEFQKTLDAYRDAAYWAGYRDAKSEILESFIKGEK